MPSEALLRRAATIEYLGCPPSTQPRPTLYRRETPARPPTVHRFGVQLDRLPMSSSLPDPVAALPPLPSRAAHHGGSASEAHLGRLRRHVRSGVLNTWHDTAKHAKQTASSKLASQSRGSEVQPTRAHTHETQPAEHSLRHDLSIAAHEKRLAPRESSTLVERTEFEAALGVCFTALHKEYDAVDGAAKVTLDELRHTLRALGYPADIEDSILKEAQLDYSTATSRQAGRRLHASQSDAKLRTSAAAVAGGGTVRLHREDFIRLLCAGLAAEPKPRECIRRLRLIAEGGIASASEAYRQAYASARTGAADGGRTTPNGRGRPMPGLMQRPQAPPKRISIGAPAQSSEPGRARTSAAYPFELVAEAHRISALVDSFATKPASEHEAEEGASPTRGSFRSNRKKRAQRRSKESQASVSSETE